MTSTINASTSSGIVQTADTSGILQLQTANTAAVTIDASQNVGIGVTPSAWNVGKAIEVGYLGSSLVGLGQQVNTLTTNAYYNAGWKYAGTGTATRFDSDTGYFKWMIAPSGTAGNAITFTQAMTLDASGNLGIGTSSPSEKLEAAGAISSTSNAANFNQNKTTLDYASGAGRLAAYVSTGSNLQFFTNPNGGTVTERMRIDSSGNLLVGTTSNPNSARLKVYASAAYVIQTERETTSSATQIAFNNPNGTVGTISTSGSSTTYSTSSDYRLKENVQPMQNALATVAQLNPVTYTWKADGSDGQGFIAHELQAVVPDCVTGEKDAVDAEGKPVYQGIDTSFLTATLTAAIQELKAIVDTQSAEIAALKGAAK